jgi:hypothetical protein
MAQLHHAPCLVGIDCTAAVAAYDEELVLPGGDA